MVIWVGRVTEPNNEVRLLVGELDAELNAEYPPEQRHGYSVERLFQPGVLFFVAQLNAEVVGCGGIAMGDGWAEVKRMYVRPIARGRGVAQAVLARLEAEAKEHGVARLVLETGDVRHAAMRLYERAGFTRRGPFGDYLAMPPRAIERSVFFQKPIG